MHYLADTSTSAGSAIGGLLLAIIIITISFAAYMAPSIVAYLRHVKDLGSIIVLNFFLGWSIVGWVVAMAMAFRTDTTGVMSPLQMGYQPPMPGHPSGYGQQAPPPGWQPPPPDWTPPQHLQSADAGRIHRRIRPALILSRPSLPCQEKFWTRTRPSPHPRSHHHQSALRGKHVTRTDNMQIERRRPRERQTTHPAMTRLPPPAHIAAAAHARLRLGGVTGGRRTYGPGPGYARAAFTAADTDPYRRITAARTTAIFPAVRAWPASLSDPSTC